MPVPVTATNPDGLGLSAHQHAALPSGGDLFSRLGASSAVSALEDKKVEQTRTWHERQADAQASRAHASSHATTASNTEISVKCSHLTFHYVGDDGAPLPGVHFSAAARPSLWYWCTSAVLCNSPQQRAAVPLNLANSSL